MSKEQKNPYNSDCIQALLDMKKALFECDLRLTDIDDILAEIMKQDSALRTSADNIMHSHKYPDKSIKHVQSATYNECPERFELSEPETKLYDLMERIQDPVTGYVSIVKSIFVDVLHFTQNERKDFQKMLNHLTETGFVTPIRPYKVGSKKPLVYKINRGVTWIGKRDKTESKQVKMNGFKQKYKRMPLPTILPNGKSVSTGTLELIQEEVSTDQNADPINNTAEPYNGSAPQDNSKRDTRKNQVNSNMPKNSNLLTPEEELMFSGTLQEGDRDRI